MVQLDTTRLQRNARFKELSEEKERRGREALALYRPVSTTDQLPFHQSRAHEIILRGGKRSGKSTAAALEFASRVLGTPITKNDGKRIKLEHPVSTKKDPLLYWVIGWDIKHIGQTIYRLLFEPGLFRVIMNKRTGKWEIWNPNKHGHLSRKDESLPAEPAIPSRLIEQDSWSWESRSARTFESVTLKNGAIIRAYPSSAKSPKQGDAVSGLWIDEDIQQPDFLKEWQDRLTDKKGWFLWSVWPHRRNYALIDLIDRAEEAKDEDIPQIEAFQIRMTDNPYLEKSAKQQALNRMGSEEEVMRRDWGDLMMDALSMYDFYPDSHVIRRESPSHAVPNTPTQVIKSIYDRGNRMPREWTRYMSIDPSHTRTAVLIAAVPPPEWEGVLMGDMVVVEREVIVKKHTANMLAKVLQPLVQGFNFEAFIMDQQIGRQTRVGADKTVFEAYAEQFSRAGISSRTTRYSFAPGCPVPNTRYRAVRRLLQPNERGTASLVFLNDETQITQSEFRTYSKKQVIIGGSEEIFDEPANPRKHDAMAATEYLCAYLVPLFDAGSAYVEPSMYGGVGSPAYRRAMQIIKKQQDSVEPYVHLGPGAEAALT